MTAHPADAEIRALSRRRFLKYGLVTGAATVTVLGGAFALLARSPKDDQPKPANIVALSSSEYHLFNAVCAASLPAAGNAQGLAGWETLPVLANIDALVASVPAYARGDVATALKLLDLAPITAHGKRFTDLSVADAQDVLRHWNAGGEIRRAISNLVRKLAYVAYWQEGTTWPAVEFDGPVMQKWGLVRLGNTPLPARYARGKNEPVAGSGMQAAT